MDHSKSYDNDKSQEKIDRKRFVRCPHPPCSPDLSLCDFWFFEMAKKQMKDREFCTVQDILRRLTEIWNDLTFEDVQSMFCEPQIRLNLVMKNGGEHHFEYNKKNGSLLNKHSQGSLSARLFGHPVVSQNGGSNFLNDQLRSFTVAAEIIKPGVYWAKSPLISQFRCSWYFLSYNDLLQIASMLIKIVVSLCI
jgi:hypothetical protein